MFLRYGKSKQNADGPRGAELTLFTIELLNLIQPSGPNSKTTLCKEQKTDQADQRKRTSEASGRPQGRDAALHSTATCHARG